MPNVKHLSEARVIEREPLTVFLAAVFCAMPQLQEPQLQLRKLVAHMRSVDLFVG